MFDSGVTCNSKRYLKGDNYWHDQWIKRVSMGLTVNNCQTVKTLIKPGTISHRIDQACSVKMAGYWPRSFFFFVFMDGP